MKKSYISILFIISFCFSFTIKTNAQLNYTFAASSGTYTANSSPTVILAQAVDFGISTPISIGFTFNFGGTNYTQFLASPDGYLTFNTAAFGSGWNNLTSSTERPIIAPLWDDLATADAGGTANDGNVNYKLTGISPNRILTIEWKKMNWSYAASNATMSFQVKLYETTNVIDFVYNQESGAVSSPSASIGLAGQCSGDYYSLNNSGTSPTSSKTTETTTIATKPANGQTYRWTPATISLTNDLCANAIALTYNIGTCSATSGTVIGATATGSPAAPACWSPSTTSEDVWYTVVKPSGQTGMIVSLDNISSSCNSFGTAFAVYSGSCGSPTLIGCADNGGTLNINNAVLTLSGLPSAATTYWIRVEGDGTTTGNFQICVRDPLCPSSLGTGVINIASLPYSVSGQTTCGMVDDLTSTNLTTCGTTWYNYAEDAVYAFTPATSGNITAAVTSSSSYVSLQLYAGCPLVGGGGSCTAYAQSYLGNQSLCTTVTAGQIYYLVIDQDNSGGCLSSYSLSISSPSGIPLGTTCANPQPIISLPYTATAQTTACYGNDYTSSTSGSCATSYLSGEDKVYQYIATGSECIGITISNATTTSVGFTVYSGCPGSGGTCLGYYNGSNPLTGAVVLPSAGTYNIIVDTWASPSTVDYDISVTSFGSGPPNDLPCNATLLTIGTSVNDDNTCSGGTGEPATPSCWTAGTLNTIWFKVVCPTSGQLKITTTLGTLTNTQIGLYSGACGTLTLVGCNDNATNCTSTTYNSQLSATGLIAGNTYYISVDGYSNLTGTFSIVADDGSVAPSATVQDCAGAIAVCSTVITSSISYLGCGNIGDIPALGTLGNPSTNPNCCNSGCQLAGELNVVWYHITIGSNGSLKWTLNPAVAGFYDWSLYPLNGTTCSDIANNLVAPVRCNWNGSNTGGTGMQSTIPGGGSASNFESPLTVTAGQQFALHLSNYSYTTGGFTIDFSNSTCGIATPSMISWTGSSGTAWATAANWGGCTPPTCTLDAYVGATTNQPIISVNSNVKSLTIAAGATLTINAGITLTICGDFLNYGTLILSPTSTILFNNGSVVHNMTGSFTGVNALGNLTITKTGGSVITNNDVDIAGVFTTSNSTSVFNTSGKYIKVGGNFVNATGNTTYTNTGTSGTLEFNGTSAQTYNQGSSILDLNKVVMNHSGTGVTLLTDMNIKATTGTLTLTAGKLITTASFKVVVSNSASACVSAGNPNSFVYGFLRRYINNLTGSYDFPVGTSTAYELANVTFTASPTITYLTADFQTYATVPAALGSSECGATYNNPALNNGFWNIDANTANNNTGTYNMTLYNTSYTNSAGSSGWTIMARHNGSATWALPNGSGSMGTCVASGVTAVARNNMNGFSKFGTAQSTAPLPIELLSFTGKSDGKRNLLEWSTASETNNDFFTLEHSENGVDFSAFATIDGAGTSTHVINYSIYDNNPFNGITYYRLKQTDFNGNFVYSSILALENKLNLVAVNNVYPNPTNNNISFDFYSPIKGKVHVLILDYLGRIMTDEIRDVSDGNSIVTTSMNTFSQGIYSLKITFDQTGYSYVSKIVKN